jgi:hypothetical protein
VESYRDGVGKIGFASPCQALAAVNHRCVADLNRFLPLASNRSEQTMEGTAMLAEIFMLRLEATVRASKESITRSTSQFFPLNLPAAPSTQISVPSIRAA